MSHCVHESCMTLPARIYLQKITTNTPYLCSHYTITPSAVNLATTLTSGIQESVNSLCGDGTNMSAVTGGIGAAMGLIILTMIAVIVVLLLRQSAKGKANKRYKKYFLTNKTAAMVNISIHSIQNLHWQDGGDLQ